MIRAHAQTPPATARTRVLAAVAVLLAAGCAPHPPPLRPTPPPEFPAQFPAAFYAQLPTELVYRVAPDESSLVVEVYRAGTLAALGHNHVITSRAVEGFVYLADDLREARADLFVPVDSFVVDDAAQRAAAGPDFASQPTAAQIDGTRTNLLGQKVLAAADHPYVFVHVVPSYVGPETTRVEVELRVREHSATVPLDVVWRRTGERLTADARFDVTHATLGLEPFEALGGVIRVADRITIAVSLTAHAGAPTAASK